MTNGQFCNNPWIIFSVAVSAAIGGGFVGAFAYYFRWLGKSEVIRCRSGY